MVRQAQRGLLLSAVLFCEFKWLTLGLSHAVIGSQVGMGFNGSQSGVDAGHTPPSE
jgi:hypothetical protein